MEIEKHPPHRIKGRKLKRLYRLVDERDGAQCVLCGSTYNLQHHHVIFHSAGGSDTIDNLVLLCENCHRMYAHGGFVDSLVERAEVQKEYRKLFLEYLHSDECKDFQRKHEKVLKTL